MARLRRHGPSGDQVRSSPGDVEPSQRGQTGESTSSSISISQQRSNKKRSKTTRSNKPGVVVGNNTGRPTGARKKKSSSLREVLPALLVPVVACAAVLISTYVKYGSDFFAGRGWETYASRNDFNLSAAQWRRFLDGEGDDDYQEVGTKRYEKKKRTVLLIGGPHRSGTTLVWKYLSMHPEISALGDSEHATKTDFNEGIFLQDVYPTFGIGKENDEARKKLFSVGGLGGGKEKDMTMLGLGRYALAKNESAVHWTEVHPMATVDSFTRVMNRFGPYWNLSKTVLLEKSPPNAILSRFLDALYNINVEGDGRGVGGADGPGTGHRASSEASPPVTKFLFVTRHPVANAYSHREVLRWAMRHDLGVLLENYVRLHRYMVEDGPHLSAPPRWLRLEDFATDPATSLRDLFDWLGVDSSEEMVWSILGETGRGDDGDVVRSDPNANYRRRWCQLIADDKALADKLIAKYQTQVDGLGIGYDVQHFCEGKK